MDKSFGVVYLMCWLILFITEPGGNLIRDIAGVLIIIMSVMFIGLLLNLFAHKSVKDFRNDKD